jgi:hypothetical protein
MSLRGVPPWEGEEAISIFIAEEAHHKNMRLLRVARNDSLEEGK